MPMRRRNPRGTKRGRVRSKTRSTAKSPKTRRPRRTKPVAPARSIAPEQPAAVKTGAVAGPVAPATKTPASFCLVLVHGIEFLPNAELADIPQPLIRSLEDKCAPTGRRLDARFAVWSDVVEPTQRRMIDAGFALANLAAGNFPGAVSELADHFRKHEIPTGQLDSFYVHALDQILGKLFPTNSLIPGQDKLKDVLSALLDILMYFTTHGQAIRDAIRGYLRQAAADYGFAPVVFAHSLGSVAILDLLREDLAAGRPLSVGALFTAGSPLGLFQPDRDDPRFAALGWMNYFDTADFVAPWNPLSTHHYATVTDYKIATAEIPLVAHTGYWGNSKIAGDIYHAF